jgi:hypothetical protein
LQNGSFTSYSMSDYKTGPMHETTSFKVDG